MQTSVQDVKERFARTLGGGGKTHVVRAPGRVNLIGEHTDYNEGLVFPMAIEPQVFIACRAREDNLVRLASTAFAGQYVEFSLDQKITPGERGDWANYTKGVAAELLAAGLPLVGMDALIDNTLPVGSGRSSSAAIEVGTGVALLAVAGITDLHTERLALLCQKAEHEYAQVPCGIMDQMIVATGRAGSAMLYDCRSGARQYIKLDPSDLRVVIVNSMVRHELSGGEYAQRRAQCEAGVAYFKKKNSAVQSLRDVSPTMIEEASDLDPLIRKRCRHVVTENARTLEAAAALSQSKYERVGQLMVDSHKSLQNDYEVSCAELDYLSEQATKIRGVYGARMTGGGFGGCIVALAQPRAVEPLRQHLEVTYEARFKQKPAVYVTTATAGAEVVE
jgi:galactokinase